MWGQRRLKAQLPGLPRHTMSEHAFSWLPQHPPEPSSHYGLANCLQGCLCACLAPCTLLSPGLTRQVCSGTTELCPHQKLLAFLGPHHCPLLRGQMRDTSYGKPSFWAPGERTWLCLVMASGTSPPGQMGKNGWVSKESVYFDNFNSCLRVRLSSHSAFALALADLKNSPMAVLASGAPYALATNSLSMPALYQATS